MASDKRKHPVEDEDERRKQDAYQLTSVIYDIYKDHKLKEKRDGQNKGEELGRVQGSS